MNSPEDPFYIGYLPKAPPAIARVNRRAVVVLCTAGVATAAITATALPYFGNGRFEFGQTKEFNGVVRCDIAPRLATAEADYLLVGAGKRGAPLEICGETDNAVTVRGELITRDGRSLIEVTAAPLATSEAPREPAATSLGRFTLAGEIVDSKCYFGVMNPAEGRAHRACAVLCLRGGVPAVFVVRDRQGATAHLLIAGPNGRPINPDLLKWAGVGVTASGEVFRQGKWLVWRIDPASLRST